MPSFDSPIGGRTFAGPPLKEFNVPDESGFGDKIDVEAALRQPGMQKLDHNSIREFQARLQRENERDPEDIEREIRQAKEARRIGKERLNEGARRRIEMLIGMTRVAHSADIDGNNYAMQTLKGKEMREAIAAAAEFDGTVQGPFEVRRQLLARSLTHVAGLEIEQFIGSNDLEARLAFVDELDNSLLNRLYDEYLEMVKQSKDKFSIKTEDEAKEVVEDIKK